MNALLLTVGLLASPTEEPPAIYALIVANNASLSEARAPLRFADDDGARYAELFGVIAEEVRLYSVFDAETQRTFPDQTDRAVPPSGRTRPGSCPVRRSSGSQDPQRSP